MPLCHDRMYQYGQYPDGNALQSIGLPSPIVDICDGDLLTFTSDGSKMVAKLISEVAWSSDLAGTRVAAKAVFLGVALGEVDSGECHDDQQDVPYAKYVAPSKFTRSYRLVDANGAEVSETWVRGQGFTFAKDPSSNKLLNDAITKTSTANQIVFRAVKDSGPDGASRAEVEFAN